MLLEKAKYVREKAYAPYSNFRVGVALLSKNHNIYVGCNIENISYSLTICAESNAISAMIANEGQYAKILDLYIYSKSDKFCFPCGACLQRIQEFSCADTLIYITHNHVTSIYKLNELLPNPFNLK